MVSYIYIKESQWPSFHEDKRFLLKGRLKAGFWVIFQSIFHLYWASLVAQLVKNLLQCGRPGFNPWVGELHWRRKWQPAPVFLPGEAHGQRSLAGYSPQGRSQTLLKQLSTQQNIRVLYILSFDFLISLIQAKILEVI